MADTVERMINGRAARWIAKSSLKTPREAPNKYTATNTVVKPPKWTRKPLNKLQRKLTATDGCRKGAVGIVLF